MDDFPIHGEYITLGQMLKVLGLVETGGQAKQYLVEKAVTVNGDYEERRGRKLMAGDTVVIETVGSFRIRQDPSGSALPEDAPDVAEETDGETARPSH